MTASVGDMLMEVKDSQKEFDEFWRVHRSRVEHIMRMCHFARSGEKVWHHHNTLSSPLLSSPSLPPSLLPSLPPSLPPSISIHPSLSLSAAEEDDVGPHR